MRKLFLLGSVLIVIVLFSGSITELLSSDRKTDFTALMKEAALMEISRRYDSALVKINQAVLTTDNPDSLFKARLMKGNQYRLLKNFEAALASLSNLDELLAKGFSLDLDQQMELEYLKGKIYTDKGEFKVALEWLNMAAEKADAMHSAKSKTIGRVYNYIGIAKHFIGDYQAALFYYNKAQKNYAMVLKGQEEDLADVLLNIGIIHSLTGQFDSSYFYLNRSLQVREEFLSDDEASMAVFYTNYGGYLLLVGQVEESLRVLQQAEKILTALVYRDEFVYATLLINLGNTYQLRADFERALIYYQKALNTFEEIVDENHPHIMTTANNIAFVYNQLGRYAESLDMSLSNATKTMKPVPEVKLYRNISRSYKGLGNFEEAEKHLSMTLDISAVKIGENHYEHAVSLIDFADFLKENRRYAEAIALYQQASRILSLHFGNEDIDLADVMRKQAHCMVYTDKTVAGIELFQMAEKILRMNEAPGHTQSGFFSLARMRLSDLYADRAEMYYRIYLQTGNTDNLRLSHQDYLQSLQMVDALGISLTDESRLRLGENTRKRYADAIAVAYELYSLTKISSYAEDAFALMGKSKAVVLLSTLRKNQAFVAGGVPGETIDQELKLRQEVLAVEKLVSEERQKSLPNIDRIKFLQSRQFNLVKQYDGLLAEIETQYPAYYSLRYNPEVITLSDAKMKLKDDEALVEYSLEDSLLHIIAFNRKDVMLLQLNSGRHIQEYVGEMRQLLFPDFTGSTTMVFKAFEHVAGSLYAEILLPVEDITNQKRLTIVPDGVLGYLPFEILLTTSDTVFEESIRADYANLPYLFIKQPITYSYSSTHRFTEAQPKAQKKRLLAIVPEYANADNIDLDVLPALPYALEEAYSVLSHWKGDLLHAGEASKTAFMIKAPEYQLLHLGMHTVINDENPMLSRFAFTNDPQGTELDLTASELYGMRLNASLVVLSACNTGSGQLRSGEGIMNLTRGFIYAGVPSIVMTNWEVNDQSGARLMELFYQNLHKGMSKDIALQHARKDYLLEANMLKAHPFFWAAYQLVGDPEPLHFHKKNSALLWVMAVFIVFIVFWWIFKKGNRLSEKLPISL